PLALPDAVARFDGLRVTFPSIRLWRVRNDSKQDVSLRGVAPKAPRRSNLFGVFGICLRRIRPWRSCHEPLEALTSYNRPKSTA
ncbi:MAG: hypothetical protein ACP5JH_11975, partial [Bacteroidota bacterium]